MPCYGEAGPGPAARVCPAMLIHWIPAVRMSSWPGWPGAGGPLPCLVLFTMTDAIYDAFMNSPPQRARRCIAGTGWPATLRESPSSQICQAVVLAEGPKGDFREGTPAPREQVEFTDVGGTGSLASPP
jgi:hypothetical protein